MIIIMQLFYLAAVGAASAASAADGIELRLCDEEQVYASRAFVL